ncbi:hypothetical protein EJB05_14808, partial [Eragrostis curvula]
MAVLPDDLVEEILLRLLPDEPALLVRAALACRQWCRLVSDPGFRRRLLARHERRRHPLLGTVRNSNRGDVVRFIPVCSIRPPRAERRGWWALDSRHGRVLLIQSSPRSSRFDVGRALAVWDPVADKLRELPIATTSTAPSSSSSWVPTIVRGSSPTSTHASKADAWSGPTYAPYSGKTQEQKLVPHLGNSLYFLLMFATRILEYNLVTRELTVIDPPLYAA